MGHGNLALSYSSCNHPRGLRRQDEMDSLSIQSWGVSGLVFPCVRDRHSGFAVDWRARFAVGAISFAAHFRFCDCDVHLGTALTLILGGTVFNKHGDEVRLFTGIKSVGYTRRFRWSDVESIDETSRLSRGGREFFIRLNFKPGTRRRLLFGSQLTAPQRAFMLRVLRVELCYFAMITLVATLSFSS